MPMWQKTHHCSELAAWGWMGRQEPVLICIFQIANVLKGATPASPSVFIFHMWDLGFFPGSSVVESPPAKQEMWV